MVGAHHRAQRLAFSLDLKVMDTVQQISVSPVGLCVAAASVASLGVYIGRCVSAKDGSLSLPPGPRPLPLVGNVLDMPRHHASDKFSDWARSYGDIVHFKVPGMRAIILNSYEVAQELLSKRPSTTGGRKKGYLLREMMGFSWDLAGLDLGPTHSHQRKMLRRVIGPQRVGSHNPMIEKGAARMMLRLQGFRGDPVSIIASEIGRLTTTLTYGEEMWRTMGEQLEAWNGEVIGYITDVLFKFWLVDVFNFLRFIPTWVPGTYFKVMAKRAKWLGDQVRYAPFAKVEELHKSGDLGHCIAIDLIEEFGPTDNARDALADLYGAGADTTSSATTAFYHALYLFPEVIRKVQAEIDAVTEGARLPEIKDRVNMPYTEAAWKEAFRWNPFLMLGLPHVNQNDEVINGLLIPKGSVIIANNGFMLMDPHVWGDPEVFRPERFLDKSADSLPNPLSVIFGYGMRVCPGLYLADQVGFQYTVTMAALFSISPLEGHSIPDPSKAEFSDTGLRLPLGFECRFIPRNEKAQHLLNTLSMEG